MTQTFIIIIVLLICFLLLGRHFHRQWKQANEQQSACSGGCTGCSVSTDCDQNKENIGTK